MDLDHFWPNPDPAKPTLHLHIYKTFLKSLHKIMLLHLLSNKISFHFEEELIQGIFFVPTAIKTLLKSRIRSKQPKSARHFLRPLYQCPSINCQTYQPYQLTWVSCYTYFLFCWMKVVIIHSMELLLYKFSFIFDGTIDQE